MMRFHALWLAVTAAALLPSPATAQTTAGPGRSTPFQVGDRILLHVQGDSAFSDTFTVVNGPALRLPEIGEISLADVPRAEIETFLARELGRYLKNPAVEARALIRISLMGEVSKPGFYAVPIDLVLPDALMLAGGATQDARIDRLKVIRGKSQLMSEGALQDAIARGATLDGLGMRAGDRIEVPRGQRDPESKWRIAGMIVTGIATAVGVIALTR
jgi:protein involved in polysaccharide export with SLBB domain